MLNDCIGGGTIPIDRALAVGRQIADALETAPDAIIHRDLKPANVKVRPDRTVKVLDFRLARGGDAVSTTEHCSTAETRDPVITDGQALLGTAGYMSPEQVRGEQGDRRADIWAFGAVLYEMLSGHAPFVRQRISETLGAVLRDDVDWTRLPAATPAGVRKLIERCLDPRSPAAPARLWRGANRTRAVLHHRRYLP